MLMGSTQRCWGPHAKLGATTQLETTKFLTSLLISWLMHLSKITPDLLETGAGCDGDHSSDTQGTAPTTSALPGASAAQASPGATALVHIFMHFYGLS